ncbi:MAG TPA: EAL domain-containing protein [Burkholderiales bacterium]|nr:EAL domain-containing protein [Burkholderiales bacterium]
MTLPNKDQNRLFAVPPPALQGRHPSRSVAFGIGLAFIAIALVIATAIAGFSGHKLSVAAHIVLELLIIIGATHIVSVCAGLWFADRDPKWLVLAFSFCVAGFFSAGQMLGFAGSGLTNVGPNPIWEQARNSAVCVALFVSVFVLSAPRLKVRGAVLVSVGLLIFVAALFVVLRAGDGVAVYDGRIAALNTAVYLVALGRASISLRTGRKDGVLVAFAFAILLGLFSELGWALAGRVGEDVVLVLRATEFATLYYGLFVLALLRPYRYARSAEVFFRTLVESSPAGIVLSRDGRILHANQAFLELIGFDSLNTARDALLWDIEAQNPEEAERYHRARERGDRGVPNTVVRRLAARDGRVIHARVEHADVQMPDGAATLTYFIDFSKTVEAQEQLKRIANYDVLTGLPNRTMLRERLEQALRVAARVEDTVAVLFIDLDQFKQVNDTLGHASGDELLKLVAHRLRDACRKEDTLGRLGGDEFIVIAQHIQSGSGADTLAAKLIQVLDSPFDLEGHEVFVGGSIGVSMFPQDAADASTMIRNADVAMYHAKREGGPRVAFYEEEMNVRALERLELGTELRWALERDEFELFYQPRVDLGTGRVAGVEALLRWRSPSRGLVLPEKFIPRLEESGLITQLGRQVLARACHAAMEWRSHGNARIPIAVNISAAQFRSSLVEDVELALSASGLPHEDLELEITESLLFRDYEQARVPLERLAAKGVKAALDDFGTGYSSLSSLHHLPVHFVKIDRSFVRALQPGRNTIVAAIINVAHTLGMRVIAEGVETVEQRDILIDLDCDEMQGYLIAPAMSSEEFPGWLSAHSAPQLFAVRQDS